MDHQYKGNGWICNLHFLSTDIEKGRGRLKLKTSAVPVHFDFHEIQSIPDASQNCSNIDNDDISISNNSCNECKVLISERNELKQLLLKNQIDTNIQMQIQQKEIEKWKEKCYDQTLIMNSLKEKNVFLENMTKHNESQISSMQKQLNLNVNCAFILLITYK